MSRGTKSIDLLRGKNAHLPGAGGGTDPQIQSMLMQAAVKEAVEGGRPIPVYDMTQRVQVTAPPDAMILADGTIRRITRFAYFRPFYDQEKAAKPFGIYMPSYVRHLTANVIWPAESPGLRPFDQNQEVVEVDVSCIVEPNENPMRKLRDAVQFRATITDNDIHADVVLRVARVPMKTWMFIERKDLARFVEWAGQQLSGRFTPAELEELQEYGGTLDELLEQFVEILRAEPCSVDNCVEGALMEDEKEKGWCPECTLRGRVYSPISNDASTGPPEDDSSDSPPTISKD